MQKVLTSLLCLAVWFGCAPTDDPRGEAEPDSMATEIEVRSVLESYYEVFSARDWEHFADHFWPGADMTTVWTPPGETVPRVVAATIPDFVAQAPLGPGSREIFEERPTSVEITVDGGLAQAWAHYQARFGDPGDIAEWEGLDAFTLLKHDGEWRITSLAYVPESR